MNKSQLVDALADRLGDRRSAATAVDALLEIVIDTVRSGGAVSLTGFGVFESRARAARTGRNPRTGEAVDVPATTVPAFRPGAGFRTAVAGAEPATGAPAATNGAGSAGAALHGTVELTEPAAPPVAARPKAGAEPKSRRKPRAAVQVPVKEPKESKDAKAPKESKDAKAPKDAKDKKEKRGKKRGK